MFKEKLAALMRSFGYPLAQIQTSEYQRARSQFTEKILQRIVGIEQMPKRISGGASFDERSVEYAVVSKFLREREPIENLIDLGMTLNNKDALASIEKYVRSVTFVNPAPDKNILVTTPSNVISVGVEDYEKVPTDFGALTCISTIEHVGFDNSQYGLPRTRLYASPTSKPLDQLARFINRALLEKESSFLVTFPIGKRQLNLHPVTFRFASQTFDKKAVEVFLEKLRAFGFRVEFNWYSIEGADFVLNQEAAWSLRYGRNAVAATGVGIVIGNR